MENYERLILELLGNDLTPKAKYERLKLLIETHRLYNAAKESLQSDLDYFGQEHKRHIQAKKTYDILIGLNTE